MHILAPDSTFLCCRCHHRATRRDARGRDLCATCAAFERRTLPDVPEAPFSRASLALVVLLVALVLAELAVWWWG